MASRNLQAHVATTSRAVKGKTYTTYLLRHSYREGGKVKHKTLANLSHLPVDLIEVIRRRLAGQPVGQEQWEIVRSLPHGNVAAVLGMIENLGLENLLASRPCRERAVVLALMAARILRPASKLATLRSLSPETATSTLAGELGVEDLTEHEMYAALDWLGARQTRVENKLAKRHLQDGTLLLYDVSSSYYTGSKPSLVHYGHNRDGKKKFPQIVYGLLCNVEGCPIAIEVFAGNTADPTTLASQVEKVRTRFGITRVVWVGDRGLITSKRIDEELRDVQGLNWVSALRTEGIRKLVQQEKITPSLFDERNLAEVTSEDFPGERLVICRNPLLAGHRAEKREALLQATEVELNKIVTATQRERNPLRGKDAIGLRVGKVLGKYKVGKHFELDITDDSFRYERRAEAIQQEAALDGIYVIRTSLKESELSSEEAVRAYKSLAQVERAFRCLKSIDVQVRPIHHWRDDRIQAHVFLCMLAFYVEWHMRQAWAPLLFEDHDRQAAEADRASIVDKAPRSRAAQAKDASKKTADGTPVSSFRSLLDHLATLTKNWLQVPGQAQAEFPMLSQPTPLQDQAFKLLNTTP